MATVADILKFVETLAPPEEKESWDNVGLLCGSPARTVTKVLISLDPFEDAAREAAEWGAEVLVTHHPLIFQPLKHITDDTAAGRTVLLLARHGIAAINAHTNLDCAPGGVNDVLARTLGLEDIRVLRPLGVDGEGRPWGLLRGGLTPEQPLEAFLELVKTRLGCPCLRYVDGGKLVRRVAVGGGACAGELADAVDAGCDTFVTADVKYNQFWEAHDLRLNLIDAGHFYTENPVCAVLARSIAGQFPELAVRISETHRDCMKFW